MGRHLFFLRSGISNLKSFANALATNNEQETALMMACTKREVDLETVRQLLAAGVAVNAHCERRRTALHRAAFHCSRDVLRELIVEHNANMFALDQNGKTPFDSAATDMRHVLFLLNVTVANRLKSTDDSPFMLFSGRRILIC